MPVVPVIVQARMSSTRLPGKVMQSLRGKTFLEHCIDRCARIAGISEVIVATTDRPDCDDLAALARKRGYRVYRGPQDDVLARYLGAARAVKADAVLRITSDCPLTDPAISTMVLQKFLAGGHDLVTTNIPPSWPNGMDSEVVTLSALEEAGQEGRAKSEREHVTTFVRRRPARYRLFNFPCPMEGVAHWRMTLDTPEDRAFFLRLAERFPGDFETAGWQELFGFIAAHPDLWAINTDEQF
jgi:spore coat polysaccharide biosynthesis protein SpsF (cytidylyltransferase family)